MAPIDMSCCDLDGDVLALWWQTLPRARQREVANAYTGLAPMMMLTHDYVERPPLGSSLGGVGLDASIGYPEALHGTGLRVVVIGCNIRWPRRPVAILLCAACGHTRCLGHPPRGWPSHWPPDPDAFGAPDRSWPRRARRWAEALHRAGYETGLTDGSTTMHRGVAVLRARQIGDDRDQ